MGHKSQSVFGAARFYINEHPNEKISPLEAYYKAEALLRKASPKLLQATELDVASKIAPAENLKMMLSLMWLFR